MGVILFLYQTEGKAHLNKYGTRLRS